MVSRSGSSSTDSTHLIPPNRYDSRIEKTLKYQTEFSPCKSLGQLSKAIEGIKVRAFTVSSQ